MPFIPALLNRAPSGKLNKARSEEWGILACFGKDTQGLLNVSH
jgi:hypothetical protein